MAQPKLPAFVPALFSPTDPQSLQYLSVGDAAAFALNYDQAFYQSSDNDFQTRHRDLWNASRKAESDALDALSGNLSSTVQNTFVSMALASSAAPLADNAPPGSIGNYAVARSVANNVESYRTQAQDTLGLLNQLFPERALGLGGQGAINVALSNEATYNETVASNNLQLNAVNTSNAIGQFNRDYAEYLREFARPHNLSLAGRTLDGLYTGWTQGSTYGLYAGVIIAVLGALDGATNGPLYRYRFNHQRDTEFSSRQYGANASLQNYGVYQEAFNGQLGPSAPAQVAALPPTSGLFGPNGPSGATGAQGHYAPSGPSGPVGNGG